jgi:hypothetical protein
MENKHLSDLIDESIRLEMNAAQLYRIFSEVYTDDSDFWWQLHLEEKSHATLIRAARDSFIKRGNFPTALIMDSIEDLKASNRKIENLIKQFTAAPLEQHDACRAAVALENESGELHFTKFMDKETTDSLESVFQQLNRGDKAHEERIRAHCSSIGSNT